MNLVELGIGLAVDLVAISCLSYAIYYRKHGKADLALAFMALNIGVFATVSLLASAEVGMGLAFGLFGILSIIRLRSTQLSQGEVAYYFVALVLGLVHALGAGYPIAIIAVDVILLTVMVALDRDTIARSANEQRIVLDRAIAAPAVLREELEFRLGADVLDLTIEEVDFIREMTVVNAKVRQRKNSAEQSDWDHELAGMSAT